MLATYAHGHATGVVVDSGRQMTEVGAPVCACMQFLLCSLLHYVTGFFCVIYALCFHSLRTVPCYEGLSIPHCIGGMEAGGEDLTDYLGKVC